MEHEGATGTHVSLKHSRTPIALRHALHHSSHHLCQGITTPPPASSLPERLRKNLLDASVAEELPEYLIWVDVMEPPVLLTICAEHVVLFAFRCITQAAVSLTDKLEGFFRSWCLVLVRMELQGQLSIRLLNLVVSGRLLHP